MVESMATHEALTRGTVIDRACRHYKMAASFHHVLQPCSDRPLGQVVDGMQGSILGARGIRTCAVRVTLFVTIGSIVIDILWNIYL